MRTGGGCRTVDREISRFPRKERLHMPGSSTTPGRPGARDDAPVRVAFRARNSVGTRGLAFAAQWLAYALPYRRFVAVLADRQRTARGRCRSLLLHRSGLAPPTPCRSPGAPERFPGQAFRVLLPQPLDLLRELLVLFRHLREAVLPQLLGSAPEATPAVSGAKPSP